MLHQVNYRSMLQKAVDIHFELNYKHLCNSPTQINDDEGGDSPIKNEEKESKDNQQEVLQSSLAEDTDKNQIDSSGKKEDKKPEYVPRDYDAACV